MQREEFEKLALSHIDSVYRMALQLVRHPDEAADLVQETYLKALRAADRFEESGGGIRPWLFKILHNSFYTKVLKAKRQPISVDELHGAIDDGPRPDEPAPVWSLKNLDWEHVDERIKDAIESLIPEYRTALLLWGVEGLKYREIAQIESVPIGTIMSRLHRARSILAKQLEDFVEETGHHRS